MKTTYLSLILSSMLVCACVGNPVQRCPDVCIAVYDPVCGSDGVVYSNSCSLAIASCHTQKRITKAKFPDKKCPDCKLCGGGMAI
ncbi:turripeptide Lol9.1-like isoform X3 [Clavelina lepadiformis]|uniref:turripeptide Lol9.1-like isoform X3 n=1 Tax=Clavelina lepadiformis TaxID=159417 RepID=UPI004042C61B